ncbi:PE family protein [Mycobacterium simiae]|uniref:PE family protein n=1 Tax=Mycobacterium simiae TaxID=1784 RepID=UPI00165F853E|nr:PE family protein [Mycobacterium simiae]
MLGVTTHPPVILDAAANVAQIRSAIAAASAAASDPTCGVLAAAADEVSVAIANAFGAWGGEYQAVVRQATAHRPVLPSRLRGSVVHAGRAGA